MVLQPFAAPVRAWFETTFRAPTPPQVLGWPAISSGEHSLILAPTGSGKTLAAFLWAINRVMIDPVPERDARTRVLYISPLRALAVDVEKNLRAPIQGIRLAADRNGETLHVPTVAIRSGDTPADERRKLVRSPPDILITTPESLYLMLTSQARETLKSVEYVIIDEIHALAGTKRGAHLSLSLERLGAITHMPTQRIGLSATQRPLEEIAHFLGGRDVAAQTWRPVTIVDAGLRKQLEIEVIVPVDDMGALGEIIDEPGSEILAASPPRRSIWPAMHPQLLDLVLEHRSTLVFVNARRLAERLATRLNEIAAERAGLGPDQPVPEVVKAHHGSLSRERRQQIEDELKRGTLKGLVATSSLELGIDMGAVDLVIQVESPGSVARGLQRIGRAGHQVGQPSRGKLFPKHRGDLIEVAVVVQRMHDGLIEETHYCRTPVDVLAQQIVAICALDDWDVAELAALVRGSANYADLSDEVFENVLDMLSGRYPSEEFAELRPRVVWDRIDGKVRGRAGAQRLAVTSGGTIPDRGLFGVFLPDGTRVGELDEEMVYESRPGETFLLGATTWRIEDITFERVIVTPAPGEPGKMPFWHGDGPGRPLELGRAMGQFLRTIRDEKDPLGVLRDRHDLDELAASNLLRYLDDQIDSGSMVPDDRTIVVERFRDEIGDWRLCILSPFGAQVHAPWAMALQARLGEAWGHDAEMLWSDDGIVLRLPEALDDVPLEELVFDPDEIDDIVIAQLPSTAMFASRFRECAGRALLLPRRRPDRRTPLWQQRQRAADLLGVASKYPQFPILLEATRECLNDVFDLPALRSVLTDIRGRKVKMVRVDTQRASPMAQSLLFGWIAVYMYAGDAPLAERRAAALSLDRELLRDLLGAEELRELLDPGVLADLELELQRLVDGRRARDQDEVHDLLRSLGPLTRYDIEARVVDTDSAAVGSWLDALLAERRVILVGFDGDIERFAAAEDAARLRDAIGVALPPGLPAAFTDSVDDPLGDLIIRYARTHGPFTPGQPASWIGVSTERVREVLDRLTTTGRLVRGEFRPDGVEREWCDDDVLRQLRRRSLAALRREVEPVTAETLARFLPEWHGIGQNRGGVDVVADVIAQLQAAPIHVSALERDVLAARVTGFRPSDLDALCTSGEVVWVGAGAVGSNDGRVRLFFRDQVGTLLPPNPDEAPAEPMHDVLREHLTGAGASFWPDLVGAVAAAELSYDDATVLSALWDLVWAGEVTNDSLAPVRAYSSGRGSKKLVPSPRRPRPGALNRVGPASAAGRWALVKSVLTTAAEPTIAAHARALQLLERYGVLTREAALGEGAVGGFAGVYPVLKALEERGSIRRGYFVEGLGAAQFALPGAVDRLRAQRDVVSDPMLLSAVDPALAYGAAIPWPHSAGRPARAAGAYVVLADGRPLVYLERGGRSLLTFDGFEDGRWIPVLQAAAGSRGKIEISKVNGVPTAETPVAEMLVASGWVRAYKGYLYRGRVSGSGRS